MFGHGGPVKVFVATRPVDFRKGIDGLALAVHRIKLLIWDQTGMVLVHKRLEGGTFVWPQIRDGVGRMSGACRAHVGRTVRGAL